MRLFVDQVSNIRLTAVAPSGHRSDEMPDIRHYSLTRVAPLAAAVGMATLPPYATAQSLTDQKSEQLFGARSSEPASSREPGSFVWENYPEMAQERALPQIVAGLRDTLFDAGSITNLSICYPPVKVKLKDGAPVQWTIMISVNSKNQYGGYAGNQGMAAVFYSTKPVWIFSIQMPLSAKQLAHCTRIADGEVKRLLEVQ